MNVAASATGQLVPKDPVKFVSATRQIFYIKRAGAEAFSTNTVNVDQPAAPSISVPDPLDKQQIMATTTTFLLPSIKPAVVVVAMMLFIQIWNDMLQQLIYINSMSKFTFAVALTNFTGSFGTNWPVALAATFMTILPGIVIYIFGQKSFVEGIVLTGMKN